MRFFKANGMRHCALWSAALVAAAGPLDFRLMWAAPVEHSVRPTPQRAIRESADRATGIVWLLVKDNGHPGGPGRLVAVDAAHAESGQPIARSAVGAVSEPLLPPLRPILRGGDSIVIEEDSPVVHLRLAGVALKPACAGQPLEARLAAGGKTVHVIALGPGRARLAAIPGAKP
jgi:hypothetical protein